MRRSWWRGMTALVAIGGAGAFAAQPPGMPPLPPPRPAFADVPLPPVRPNDVAAPTAPTTPILPVSPGPREPSPLPPPAPPPAAAVLETAPALPSAPDQTCVHLLGSGTVVAHAIPAISGPNGCGIAAPIELAAILASPTQRIAFEPPVTVACGLAEAVAAWVRDDLVPAFAAAGPPLVRLASTSGYACRGRNGIVGAKVSEHGHGDAMDIGSFGTADGKAIGVGQRGAVIAAVRATACARFATVLGPGSDGFHESHMHVDLEARRNNAKLCHWDMPGPPAPTGPR